MSIPLDRLYHYIESIAQDIRKGDVVIYRFFPHGSKKFEDIKTSNHTWVELATLPQIYCNDQEPLDYNAYQTPPAYNTPFCQLLKNHNIPLPYTNFRNILNIYDRSLLIHSEKRSRNLEQYQQSEFISVYYWSHAVIARDWFRYAEHIAQKKKVKKLFLVYNRAWSGTREYRLGFADRLIILGLVDHVLMRVSPVDSAIDKHYDLHKFENPHWRPHNVIEKYFPLCEADSHSSADFDLTDYEATNIEVVLETLFDDLRLHLTEKTLRPIAMGQPFMLAATYGSLKYLRKYGFKTFADCWDESYDMMSDSIERMNKIVEVMGDIINMPPDQRKEMLIKAQAIADYNKKHFFSNEFKQQVETELTNNLARSLDELEKTNTSVSFLERRKHWAGIPELKNILTGNQSHPDLHTFPDFYVQCSERKNIAQIIKATRKYKLRSLSQD